MCSQIIYIVEMVVFVIKGIEKFNKSFNLTLKKNTTKNQRSNNWLLLIQFKTLFE